MFAVHVKPRSRTHGRRRLIVLLAVALVSVACGYAWRLARLPPAWWAPPAAADPEAISLAQTVEYRVAEEAHRAEPQGPRRLRVLESQVNAWLAVRLPQWLHHTGQGEWPDGVGMPQVHFSAGAVTVGVSAGGRYLSATLHPAMVDGSLRLPLAGAGLGRLQLPGASAQTLLGRLRDVLPPGAVDDPRLGDLGALLSGERGLDPEVELADGRRLRLLGATFGEGDVILEFGE